MQRQVQATPLRSSHRIQRRAAGVLHVGQRPQQLQVRCHRLAASVGQRKAVGQQHRAVGGRQRGEISRQLVVQGLVVLDDVVAAAACIGAQRFTAAARQFNAQGFAIEHHGALGCATGQAHRHAPWSPGQRVAHRKAALLQHHHGGTGFAGRADLDQRQPRLVDPAGSHSGHRLAGNTADMEPEVTRGRWLEGALGHVGHQATAEGFFTDPLLEHAQHSTALAVGDVVEDFKDTGFADRARPDSTRCRAGVARHRAFKPAPIAQHRLPFGMKVFAGLVLHPGGKSFVEPDLVPGRHRHQVAKPLVRNLVRHHRKNAALGVRPAARGVIEQRVFDITDEPPVFHGTVPRAGHRDLVELGQRIGAAEVAAVEGQNLLRDRHRKPGLFAFAWRREDAKRRTRDLVLQHVKAAHRDSQQVAGHGRRGREVVAHLRARRSGPQARHVGQHLQALGRQHAQCKHAAEHRLVKHRQQAPRFHGLQLGGQHARGLTPDLVIDAVQPFAAAAHLPAVANVQTVSARRDGLAVGRQQVPGAACRIHLHLQRPGSGLATNTDLEMRHLGLQVLRMDFNLRHALTRLQLDRDLALESVQRRVQVQHQLNMRRQHRGGQARGRAAKVKTRL